MKDRLISTPFFHWSLHVPSHCFYCHGKSSTKHHHFLHGRKFLLSSISQPFLANPPIPSSRSIVRWADLLTAQLIAPDRSGEWRIIDCFRCDLPWTAPGDLEQTKRLRTRDIFCGFGFLGFLHPKERIHVICETSIPRYLYRIPVHPIPPPFFVG